MLTHKRAKGGGGAGLAISCLLLGVQHVALQGRPLHRRVDGRRGGTLTERVDRAVPHQAGRRTNLSRWLTKKFKHMILHNKDQRLNLRHAAIATGPLSGTECPHADP